jgi:hypothetical protein
VTRVKATFFLDRRPIRLYLKSPETSWGNQFYIKVQGKGNYKSKKN